MARRKTSTAQEDVGPGRPPKSTQFHKGQSGNPGGRPKKERDLAKLVDSALDETVTVSENGKPTKLTKRELVAKTLVNDAAKGNLKALDRVISLLGSSARDENSLIGIEPAVLASFLARHGGAIQQQGGDR